MKKKLTQRDRACIEYGRWFSALRREYAQRHHSATARHYAHTIAKHTAREARDCIFRSCYDCVHLAPGASPSCALDDDPILFDPQEACTCHHYAERREA